MTKLKIVRTIIVLIAIALPVVGYAQAELIPDVMTFSKAKVLEISSIKTDEISETDTPTVSQTLKVEVLSGDKKGEIVTFENEFIQLSQGDIFYLRHLSNEIDATEYYSVADPYRLDVLITLAVAFLLLAAIFGGMQGVRGLASLGGSLILIFYLLIPGILQGYSPILVAIGVSSLIIIAGSYITHGFNKTTSAAVLGMIVTVLITGIAAYFVMDAANLSGYASEESAYLNFNTRGAINMVGLLFGGVMIGLLGVLYDSAIGQAIAVEELFRAGKHMTRLQVYKRAIRMGREHIGALINTLAIAYVGAALPLLLLVSTSSSGSFGFILNSELFATEIIRILIGSIGLILAVPITTLIAAYVLASMEGKGGTATGHSHAH
ncbi:MAG: YibE/F family protein [Minisyncoccota bacterium]